MEFLFGLDAQQGCDHILDQFNVKLAFVTCGANGCYFGNGKASGFVPALADIQVKDTTGAGDIFGGSAVWKLLQLDLKPDELTKEQLCDVVSFACASAGLSTTKSGGISSVPSLEEIAKI